MKWIQRLYGVKSEAQVDPPPAAGRREVRRTERQVSRSVVYALRTHEVIDHSARVAAICRALAERLTLSEADVYVLETAARLHEVGMLAVPRELVRRPAPLSPMELQHVRSQARLSAEVARTNYPAQVAMVIENQYTDYAELVEQGFGKADLTLIGILRIADVVAAITWPRPYQEALSPERRAELLTTGAGRVFHPIAAAYADELATLDLALAEARHTKLDTPRDPR